MTVAPGVEAAFHVGHNFVGLAGRVGIAIGAGLPINRAFNDKGNVATGHGFLRNLGVYPTERSPCAPTSCGD